MDRPRPRQWTWLRRVTLFLDCPVSTKKTPQHGVREVLYQRQLLLTFVRPVPQSDGHDRLWLIDELVPSFATGLDDGVIIFEDAVGEPILAQVLPDILDRVQLG